jgi:CRP/FNR family transcriptional activator FtrB
MKSAMASNGAGANPGVEKIVKRRRARRLEGLGIADLKSIRLFAQVPPERLQQLAAAASQQRVALRAPVIEEGEPCVALLALLEGTVEVFSRFDDQETVIDVVQPGAALLLACVMTGLPYAAAARTLSPARILAVPAAAVRELFDGDRTFARAVADELSRASHRTLAELKSLKMHTSVERLADWLLRADARTHGNGQFRLPFGKRTLASRLGMTPECLSRSLRNLADHGLTVRGRDVTVADRMALATIVGTVAAATDCDC